jgi:hypothetical protein
MGVHAVPLYVLQLICWAQVAELESCQGIVLMLRVQQIYSPVDVKAIVAVFLHSATENVQVRWLGGKRVGDIAVVAAEKNEKH